MERTIEVWIGDTYLEFDLDIPEEWDEDTIYEHVCDYVFRNISIGVK